METFSSSLALWAGSSPVTGEFPAQKPVTRSFDVFFDLCLNKRLSKQSRRRRFETPSCSLWRHCNVINGRHEKQCPHEYSWIEQLFDNHGILNFNDISTDTRARMNTQEWVTQGNN